MRIIGLVITVAFLSGCGGHGITRVRMESVPTHVTLTWSVGTDASSYIIQMDQDRVIPVPLSNCKGSGCKFIMELKKPGLHLVKVRAENDYGISEASMVRFYAVPDYHLGR